MTPQIRQIVAFQQVGSLARPTWPHDGVPQQLHLDITVGSLAEFEEAHERAMALGAQMLYDRSQDQDEPLRAYADPDGHPFCLFVAFD